MTRDRNFKDLVRSRRERTGESYVEARRQLRRQAGESRPPRLVASFPRNRDRFRWVATLQWDDGLVGEMAIRQKKQLRMPHDLEHYVVDATLGHEFAFWPLLARYGAFKSVRLRNGSFGRERMMELSRVLAEHKDDVDGAETLTAPVRVIAHHDLDWPEAEKYFRSSPARARFESLTRADVATLVENYRRMERRWLSGPTDEPLVVEWPPYPETA